MIAYHIRLHWSSIRAGILISIGKGIVEHDYTMGQELTLEIFPSPEELWKRLCGELGLVKDQVGNVRPEGLDRISLDYVSPEKAQTLKRYSVQNVIPDMRLLFCIVRAQ